MRTLVGLLLVALLAAISNANVTAQTGELRSTAELKNANGQSVGTLTLIQEGDVVHLKGTFMNLPSGAHGIHLHAVGSCTPDFTAAGGHYNPTGKKHGLENPEGAHPGDMPNLQINADGTGSYDHKNPMVTLREGATTLFDADGSSIVIHAGPDDYKTDPAGNSGARIACAVIPAAQRDTPAASPMPSASPAPGSGAPVRLPDTGSALPWLPLLLLAGLGIVSGVLVTRRARSHS